MLKPWLPIPVDSDFSIHNLPFGIFSDERPARAGLAVGNWVLDLAAAYALNMFPHHPEAGSAFRKPVLNELIGLGRGFSEYVRKIIRDALCDRDSVLRQFSDHLLVPQDKVQMHMPIKVGNYTDFYSSEEHAFSVGQLFRPENPLFPNWKHLPVAYHGRASSVVVSGTPVTRPCGQIGQKSGILFLSVLWSIGRRLRKEERYIRRMLLQHAIVWIKIFRHLKIAVRIVHRRRRVRGRCER